MSLHANVQQCFLAKNQHQSNQKNLGKRKPKFMRIVQKKKADKPNQVNKEKPAL